MWVSQLSPKSSRPLVPPISTADAGAMALAPEPSAAQFTLGPCLKFRVAI